MLGDGGDQVAGSEDPSVLVNPGVHPGLVDDGAVFVHRVGWQQTLLVWIPTNL